MNPQTAKDLKRAALFVTQDQCRRFVNRATYGRLNARRVELIDRYFQRNDLTPEEEAELATLQREVGRLVNTAYPFKAKALEKLRRLHAELKARILAGEDGDDEPTDADHD